MILLVHLFLTDTQDNEDENHSPIFSTMPNIVLQNRLKNIHKRAAGMLNYNSILLP